MDIPSETTDDHRKGLMHAIEMMLAIEGFQFDRTAEDEIRFTTKGTWCDYTLWFTPSPDGHCLQLCLSFDEAIPDSMWEKGKDLIMRINEHMPFGHFDVWSDDGQVVWRHAHLTLTPPTLDDLYMMVSLAMSEAECFYPAVHGLVHNHMSTNDAMDAALFQTVGHA